MNPLDYVLIGVLLFCLIAGYIKGFLAQLLQILAIIASFLLASRFHVAVAENSLFETMRRHSPSAAQVTAFLGIFFVVGAILSVLTSMVAKRFQNEHMKAGDRWLGALFSTAKGALILGGIALGLQEWKFPSGVAIPADQQAAAEGLVTSSKLVPRLAETCLVLVDMIPAAQRQEIRDMVRERRLHLDRPTSGGQIVTTTPNESKSKTEEEAKDGPKSILLPLGELRRLTQRKEDGDAKPVPSSAKESDETQELIHPDIDAGER